jgi:hypothetical protein
MSQIGEAQTKRTGCLAPAGVMTIVSACLLIIVDFLELIRRPALVFWIDLPGWLSILALYVLAVVGGALVLTRPSLLVAVFSASVLIPASLSLTATFGSLLWNGILTLSLFSVLWVTLPPVALVLSVSSVIFAAVSRPEFS